MYMYVGMYKKGAALRRGPIKQYHNVFGKGAVANAS